MKLRRKIIFLMLSAAIMLSYGWSASAQEASEAEPYGDSGEEGAAEEAKPETEGDEEAVGEAGEEEESEAEAEEEEAAGEEEAEEEAGTETPDETPPAEEEAEAEGEAAGVEDEVTAAGAGGGDSDVTLEADAKPKKQSSFRNSYFLYENVFSAYSLKKDADLTYNPYYAMSYSIRPRYYLWKGLYLGLRWDLEQELTDSDSTTKKRQVMWSDVIIDLNWSNAYKIPAIDFIINPKIRIALPASLESQARTQYLSLGPGFDLVRIFDVWGGITIWYAFRYTKYFNQYSSALSEEPVLNCPEKGPCRYDVMGPQNPSHQFLNDFIFEIRPLDQLYISVTVEIRNYLLYELSDAEYETAGGTQTKDHEGTSHRGYMWYLFEIGYDVLPYLTLALGTSTYNPMLSPESEYYAPFFNRYTNIYFDVAIDIDGMIHGIMGKKKKSKTATERM